MAGTEIPGGGRGRLYLTLHCHHQIDSSFSLSLKSKTEFPVVILQTIFLIGFDWATFKMY